MTNLMRTVEHETADRKYGILENGILVLPEGDGPQTIHVAAFDQNGSRVPAFALSDQGPWFHQGFSWKSREQPLEVTFAFSQDVAGVRTSHSELMCSTCGTGKQTMRIPPNEAQYKFDVEWTAGGVYDPIIVVTPIDQPGVVARPPAPPPRR